jgi:N-acetylmuramoyl-L-alanine amidase
MGFFKWLKSLFSTLEQASSVEAKPVEAKPVEAKPVEAKPVEAKPVEAKPVEAKPVEAKPVEAKPVEAKPSNSIIDKETKIAIIVGHTPKSQGAVNYKGETEFVFNSRIAEKIKQIMLKKYPKKKVQIFFREEGYYSTAVVNVAKNVGKWKARVSLELHFNSFKDIAYGCEILVWEGAKNIENTIKIADIITDDLSKKFKLRERGTYKYSDGKVGDGVQVLASKARGALNIKACNDEGVVHAMLIEPCFANKETSESKAIFENEDEYAEFLADSLAKINV